MTGGPYAYVETAFGPFVGFLSGVLLWVRGHAGAVGGVATFFADVAVALVPAFGADRAARVALVVVLGVLAAANVARRRAA